VITLTQFQTATSASPANAVKYFDAFVSAAERFKVSDQTELAALCATISVESMRLTAVEEGMYYKDAGRLADIFPRAFASAEEAAPYCRNSAKLSSKLYNGFHGRGPIQLTWEHNYRLHGDLLGLNFVANPDVLLRPEEGMLAAFSFWAVNKCGEVAADMNEVTKRVNGPRRMHLQERMAQFAVAKQALGV